VTPADDIAGVDETLARLDALLDNAPVGLAFFDRDLRFERVNAALAALNRVPVEDHYGRTAEEVTGAAGRRAHGVLERVRDTGQPELDVVVDGLVDEDDRPLKVLGGFYPVRVRGEVVGVGVVVRDVTAQTAAEDGRELLFRRVASLAAVTTGLAVANGSREAAQVVLEEGSRALGAVAALVTMRPAASEPLQVLGARNLPRAWADRWLEADASPHSDVLATGEAVWLADSGDIAVAYPALAGGLRELGVCSVAAAPLVAEGEILGVLAFGYPDDHGFDDGERTFFGAFTGACAAALERARLYDRQQRARERLTFLAEASGRLVASLEWEETLHLVASLAVPAVADLCIVFLLDDAGVPRPFDVTHTDPTMATRTRRLLDRYPIDPTASSGLGAALRRREIVRFSFDEDYIDGVSRSDEHRELLRELGIGAGVLVPIVAAGRAVGAMVLAVDVGRTFEEDDATLAQELAVRAAQAVGNARLFTDRTHIAEVLQQSLLPRSTGVVPGVDVATRFVAGGEGLAVGGDFYDVFAAGAGDTGDWVVAIGDVRGKGVEAAALTGTARNTIRSAALLHQNPCEVLQHLNAVLLATSDGGTGGEPRFCTAVLAYLTPEDRGLRARLVVGGHPLPYLLRRDGTTEAVGRPGTLLGVVPHPELHEVDLHLQPGDALVLYTDGVTERHADDRFFDDEGLLAVLARCVGFTGAALAERIETAARAFVEDDLRDDLAIVVVRVPDRTTASTSASTDLPAETSSARRARRFVVAALEALGVGSARDTAELLVSEVVTNAVVHGGSGVRVTVESTDGRVRVSVVDENPNVPIVRQPVPDDEHGRGMFLVSVLSNRWGVDPVAPGKCVWFELPGQP
jgi:serine phosphatase RsbU (regulator of sigma subunit)/anti-sigma regulatory factor (Ser/Thr protein kinase)